MVRLTLNLMKFMTPWYPTIQTHTSDQRFFKKYVRWGKLMSNFNYRHRREAKLGQRRWMICVRESQKDRPENKSIMRDLFSQRIWAAVNEHRFPYKYFLGVLPRLGIELDRKVLAQLAIHEPRTFESLIAICQTKVGSAPVGEEASNIRPHPGVVVKGGI